MLKKYGNAKAKARLASKMCKTTGAMHFKLAERIRHLILIKLLSGVLNYCQYPCKTLTLNILSKPCAVFQK